MNNKLKTHRWIILTLTLICGLFYTTNVYADDAEYITYSAGENITAYLYNDGRMEFKGEGATYIWNKKNVPWNEKRSDIIQVTFEDGITEIGSYAFYDCKELIKVEMTDSIQRIDDYTFGNCEKLSDIKLSENLNTIYGGAFKNCISLKEIDIPKSLKYVYGANEKLGIFTGCTDLKINLAIIVHH